MNNSSLDWIIARGLEKAIDAAHIQQHPYNKHDGVKYPVHRVDGSRFVVNATEVFRWKNSDTSNKTKYVTIPTGLGDKGPKYYLMPQANLNFPDGKAFVASGEPDVWAYHCADILNAYCTLGEGSRPTSYPDFLKALRLQELNAFPDMDDTGDKWGKWLHGICGEIGIRFSAWQLPDTLGDKGDINKLWVACGYDTKVFRDALDSCPVITYPVTQPVSKPISHADPLDMPQAYYDAIQMALDPAMDFNADGWSKKPFPCPMVSHSHDSNKPAAYWHRDKHILKCHKCGDATLSKPIAETLKIDYRVYLDQKPSHRATLPPTDGKSDVVWQPAAPPAKESIFIGQSSYQSRPLMKLIRMPFNNIARLGGFAAWLPSGKMTAVVGLSGGNKTTFIESMLDYLMIDGHSALLFSPEWNKIEYQWRTAQRMDGPSYMESMVNEGYWAERANGLSDKQVRAKGLIPFPAEMQEYLDSLISETLNWPGQIYHLPTKADIETLLTNAQQQIDYCKSISKPVSVVVWDYLTRITTSMGRSQSEQIAQILSLLSEFTTTNNLHTVVVSQVTKFGAAQANTDGLKTELMQAARSDVFNLVLMLKQKYDEANQRYMPLIECSVGKNSMAAISHDPVYLYHDDRRKRITDYLAPKSVLVSNGNGQYHSEYAEEIEHE